MIGIAGGIGNYKLGGGHFTSITKVTAQAA